jgi:hypothetical protein
MFSVPRLGDEPGLVDCRIEPWFAVAEGVPGAMGPAWRENGVPALQLQRHFRFGGVSMDDGKPLQVPVLSEQIDHAPVGQGGHDQVRNALQLGFVVERASQDLTRLGEESDVVLSTERCDEVLTGNFILWGDRKLLRSGRQLRDEDSDFACPFSLTSARIGDGPQSRRASTSFHAGDDIVPGEGMSR